MKTKQPNFYKNEEIIASLRHFLAEYGEKSRSTVYREQKRIPSYATIRKYFGSWENAIQETLKQTEETEKNSVLLVAERKKQAYTEEELLEAIRLFVQENEGKTSSKLYTAQKRIPSFGTICHHFGSWERAFQKAGCLTKKEKYKNACLLSLKQFLRENEGNTSSGLYAKQKRIPSASCIIKHFGSWKQAVEEAGYTHRVEILPKWSEADMEEAIRQFVKDSGGLTNSDEYRLQKRKPHIKTILNHYGSWHNALKAAGCKHLLARSLRKAKKEKITKNRAKTGHPRYSEADMLASVKRFYEENGGLTSSTAYYQQKRTPSYQAILQHFGSWDAALEKAGCDTQDAQMKKRILASIRLCAEENEGVTDASCYKEGKYKPTMWTIRKYFGSWDHAVETAFLNKKKMEGRSSEHPKQ